MYSVLEDCFLRVEELDSNAFFLTSYYMSIVSDWRKSVKKQLDVT